MDDRCRRLLTLLVVALADCVARAAEELPSAEEALDLARKAADPGGGELRGVQAIARFEASNQTHGGSQPVVLIQGRFIAIADGDRRRVDIEFDKCSRVDGAFDAHVRTAGRLWERGVDRVVVMSRGSTARLDLFAKGKRIESTCYHGFESTCYMAGFPFRDPFFGRGDEFNFEVRASLQQVNHLVRERDRFIGRLGERVEFVVDPAAGCRVTHYKLFADDGAIARIVRCTWKNATGAWHVSHFEAVEVIGDRIAGFTTRKEARVLSLVAGVEIDPELFRSAATRTPLEPAILKSAAAAVEVSTSP